jgi:hypothetical protein
LYWIRKRPFFGGDLGAVLGVALGIVLGPPVTPAEGRRRGFLFFAGYRQQQAKSNKAGERRNQMSHQTTTDHGKPEAGGRQSKGERRGDRRGKPTNYLVDPRERERESKGTSLL